MVGVVLAGLAIFWGAGCLPSPWSVPATGVAFKPGRYLCRWYQAPAFNPTGSVWVVDPFHLEEATGADPKSFLALFQAEVAAALEANGLKGSNADAPCRLSGTIARLRVSSPVTRRLLNKITAHLEVAGAITKGDEVMAAFEDRFSLSSPINPGPPHPKETDLLLRRICQEFARHLLNELMLRGQPRDAGQPPTGGGMIPEVQKTS